MNQLLKDSTLFRVLDVFFDNPIKDFQLREISRMIGLTHKSVLIYLNQLLKLELIKINTKTLYTMPIRKIRCSKDIKKQ